MDHEGKGDVPSGPESMHSKSERIARQGIITAKDFVSLMSAIISDLSSGTISPRVANSMVGAGNTMLKAVEMTYQYRHLAPQNRSMDLVAIGDTKTEQE